MTIVVNGKTTEIAAGETLLAVIASLELSPDARGVAVAVDGEVVPQSVWSTARLPADAQVEVLTAMQGG